MSAQFTLKMCAVAWKEKKRFERGFDFDKKPATVLMLD